MTLTPHVAARVRKLIPSLGSSFDGEVIATRNAIGRELATSGADWHELADSLNGIPHRPDALPRSAEPLSFGDLARACRDLDQGRLTERERTFVAEMCALGFVRQPTPKQRAWLRAIFDSLRPRAAA